MTTIGPGAIHASTADVAGLLQEAEQVFAKALKGAMQPLERRYGDALTQLLRTQSSYHEELKRRLATAYQSYSEDVASISVGSPNLEATKQALANYVEKIGDYNDPRRWSDSLVTAQTKLTDTLRDAEGKDDAQAITSDAVTAYYATLNSLVQDDPLVGQVTDAQAQYADRLQAMFFDIEAGWQKSITALNENVMRAVAQTGEAFDLKSALETFTTESATLADETAKVYRAATESASKHWTERSAQPVTPAPTTDKAAMARAAAASAVSPFAMSAAATLSPIAPPAAPTPAAAAPTAAVSTATMPRASWVNIPEPPTESRTNEPDAGEPTPSANESVEDSAPKPAAGEEKKRPGRAAAKPSGGRPPGKPDERKDS